MYDAALDWLHRWVRKGEKPPSAPALETTVDQNGNVQGGVRIQDIDVPIATYTKGNAATSLLDIISLFGCGLSGSVVALTPEQPLQLYPTHNDEGQHVAPRRLALAWCVRSERDISSRFGMQATRAKASLGASAAAT